MNVGDRVSANISAGVRDGVATVVVRHPDGGASEVVVYLDSDGLNVNIGTSSSNGWVITRDDVDIDKSTDYEGIER